MTLPWMKYLISVAVAVTLAGCSGGPKGPQMFDVNGDVTFDGKPVDEGRILFRMTKGDQKGFSAEIKNGQYELKTEEGPMTVEITASRIIPGKFTHVNLKPEPVGEMYIPAKYNAKTELKAEVKPGGSNSIPFALTSK